MEFLIHQLLPWFAVEERLGKYNITLEKLQEGQAAARDVELKLEAQLKEKGEAQQAAVERDFAFDDLQEWVRFCGNCPHSARGQTPAPRNAGYSATLKV